MPGPVPGVPLPGSPVQPRPIPAHVPNYIPKPNVVPKWRVPRGPGPLIIILTVDALLDAILDHERERARERERTRDPKRKHERDCADKFRTTADHVDLQSFWKDRRRVSDDSITRSWRMKPSRQN